MQQNPKNNGFFSNISNKVRQVISRATGKPNPSLPANETPFKEIDKFRRKLFTIPAYEETIVHFMYPKFKELGTQHRLTLFVMVDMVRTDKGYKEVKTSYGYQGSYLTENGFVNATDVNGIKKFPRGEIFDFIFLANKDGWTCTTHAEELIDDFIKNIFTRYTKFSKVQEIKNLISYEYTMPFGNLPPQIKVAYPDPTNQEVGGIAPTLVIDFVKTPGVVKN